MLLIWLPLYFSYHALQHFCPCLLGLSSLARTTASAPPTSSTVSQTHQLCSCQSVNVKPDSLNLIIAHLTFSVSPGQDKFLSLQLATGPCGLAPISISPYNSYQPLSGAQFSGNNKLFAVLLQLVGNLCLWSFALSFVNSCPSPKTHFCSILFQETVPCLIAY